MKRLKNLSALMIAGLITVACGTEEDILNSNVSNTTPTQNKVLNSKSYVDLKKSSLFKGKTIKKSASYKPIVKALSAENTNFRYKSKQWHLRDVKALDAWEATTGNKELIVAVIDSGVDYNHPDLKNRVIQGPDYGDSDNDPMDADGHGTHVSGIIAGNGNIKGIAPNVKIMALKVFSDKEPGAKRIDEAIIYAIENGASIINLSLGSNTLRDFRKTVEYESAINEAVAKGLVVFTAAGNESYSNVSTQKSVQSNINQIPVIATDETQKISEFSTYSNLDHPKAISAPGVNIYSAMPTSLACRKTSCEMPYQYMDGTSMASPVAAGVMALVESAMYEDYVRVVKEFQNQGYNDIILTFKEFFHTKQKQAMMQLGISIPPARLAEQILFSYTNKDNSYMQSTKAMAYPARRDPVFGFGIVNAGAATKAASQVFSAVYLE